MIVSKRHWPCSETHEAFAQRASSRVQAVHSPAAGALRRLSGPVKRNALRGFVHMITKFNVGDHVRWNSESGYVSGMIIKVHTRNVDYKGYVHHASPDDPQYEIQSDKSGHVAIHKGSALRILD
jgi:hypothetical protein